MKKITIVTGNPGKVQELQAMAMGKLDFVMHELNINEIQSMDLQEIVEDKLRKAYDQVKAPVIVDDVSAGLANLKGLPGPFIKFFNEILSPIALFQLAGKEGVVVTITCLAAYYDGQKMIIGKGVLKGKIVRPRGSNGFGFDSVVVPDGQTLTMAQMTTAQKMLISHRGKAFRDLLKKLG